MRLGKIFFNATYASRSAPARTCGLGGSGFSKSLSPLACALGCRPARGPHAQRIQSRSDRSHTTGRASCKSCASKLRSVMSLRCLCASDSKERACLTTSRLGSPPRCKDSFLRAAESCRTAGMPLRAAFRAARSRRGQAPPARRGARSKLRALPPQATAKIPSRYQHLTLCAALRPLCQ